MAVLSKNTHTHIRVYEEREGQAHIRIQINIFIQNDHLLRPIRQWDSLNFLYLRMQISREKAYHKHIHCDKKKTKP